MEEKNKTIIESIEKKGLRLVDIILNMKMSHIALIFIFLLFSFLVINEVFLFSYNYKLENKISGIERIEAIKKNHNIKNEDLLIKLNVLEKQIIEEESVIRHKPYFINYIDFIKGNYKKGKFLLDKISFKWIFHLLSITFIWIILTLISFYNIIFGKNKEGMFPLFIISIIFLVFWYYIVTFLNGFLGTQSIFWNIFYNLILILFFGIIGRNNQTLKPNK